MKEKKKKNLIHTRQREFANVQREQTYKESKFNTSAKVVILNTHTSFTQNLPRMGTGSQWV